MHMILFALMQHLRSSHFYISRLFYFLL